MCLRLVGGLISALISYQAVLVQAMAGVVMLCSWKRHFTLAVILSTLMCNWLLASVMLGDVCGMLTLNLRENHPICTLLAFVSAFPF